MALPPLSALPSIFGDIDIYFFDQLLKGNLKEDMVLLDAGCGSGRNIQYLMQAGVNVHGADASEAAIAKVKQLAQAVAPNLPDSNFIVSDLAALPWPDIYFDVVLCSAVLHFSKSEAHFVSMVRELWRVLKPGGMLFCRLSTTIGLEEKLTHAEGRFYKMAHGPVWFLADEALLLKLEKELHATRAEPLKTVLVEQERSMTTWVLRK